MLSPIFPSDAHTHTHHAAPVVGLIHDLGKLLNVLWGEPQWAVVGDTFPTGCKFSEKNVFPEAFASNADAAHAVIVAILSVSSCS